MIELQKVYDLIGQAFHYSHDTFHWGNNAIIQGSLKNIPASNTIDQFNDGDYFACVDVSTVIPNEAGHPGLVSPDYAYEITLCHKGKIGDITKLRNDMIDKFAEGWWTFWQSQGNWQETVPQIFTHVDELEESVDIIAVQFVGTISHITQRGRRIDD